MSQPEIRIYTGNIREWTKDLPKGSKKTETICGRRLLAYALLDTGRATFFPQNCTAQEVYEILEKRIERTVHGKPVFRDFPELHFNISHSGEWASCALSTIPCGLDIQEIRPIRTRRLLEKTMSEEEQKHIKAAGNPEWEFCRYWSMKESFLKLTGEGITRSMRELPRPAWYEMFVYKEKLSGCISAGEACQFVLKEVLAEDFFRIFRE